MGPFYTLYYLCKGGRIGVAKALVGALLRIKPVLKQVGGGIRILKKSRTMVKAIADVWGFIENEAKRYASFRGYVARGHALDATRALEKGLRKRFDWPELRFL